MCERDCSLQCPCASKRLETKRRLLMGKWLSRLASSLRWETQPPGKNRASPCEPGWNVPQGRARGRSVHASSLGVKTVCTRTWVAHTHQLSRRGDTEIGGLLLQPLGRGHGRWETHFAPSLTLVVALCARITPSHRFYEAGEGTGGKPGCRRHQGARCPSAKASAGSAPKCAPCQGLWEMQFDPWDWEHGLSPAAPHPPGSPLQTQNLGPPQTCDQPLDLTRPQEVQFERHCLRRRKSGMMETLGEASDSYQLYLTRVLHLRAVLTKACSAEPGSLCGMNQITLHRTGNTQLQSKHTSPQAASMGQATVVTHRCAKGHPHTHPTAQSLETYEGRPSCKEES